MKRSRLTKTDLYLKEKQKYENLKYNNFWMGVIVLEVLITLMVFGYLKSIKKTLPHALETPITVNAVESTKPFCRDVVGCIRDIGTEMGESNKDIMQMIRIAKYESGYRTDAINKNTNGTYDIGIFMINDVHSKRISRADRFDMEKNIRFAYKLHQEQGHSFTAWVVYNTGIAR